MRFLSALIVSSMATQEVFAFVKRDASNAENYSPINCPHREKSEHVQYVLSEDPANYKSCTVYIKDQQKSSFPTLRKKRWHSNHNHELNLQVYGRMLGCFSILSAYPWLFFLIWSLTYGISRCRVTHQDASTEILRNLYWILYNISIFELETVLHN